MITLDFSNLYKEYSSLSILIIFSIFIFLVWILKRKTSIPLVIIIFWWMSWNLVASFSLTGMKIIHLNTQLMYFIFFTFCIIAVYIETLSKKYFNLKKYSKKISTFNNFYLKNKINSLFYLLLVFLSPLMIYLFVRSIYLMNYVFSMSEYRSDVYGLLTGSSTLFHNSNQFSFFYFNFISPILFFSLIIGVAIYLSTKTIKILILSSFLFSIDAIMTAGRFGFHYLIFSYLFLSLVLLYSRNKNTLKKIIPKLVFIFIPIIFLIILSFSIGMMRKNNNHAFKDFFNIFLIQYHTTSFVIMDNELLNINSIIHNFTFGRSIFAGLEKYASYLMHVMGQPSLVQADYIGGYLHENQLLGINDEGKKIWGNAFGSIFFSMYRDGGYKAIALYGFLYGLLISRFSIAVITKNIYYMSILLSLMFIGIYGIFQPFTSGAILPAILCVMFYSIISRFTFKYFPFFKKS